VDFISELSKRLKLDISNDELAGHLTQAAQIILFAAASGETIEEGLTYNQAGTIMAALQWNYNPAVRNAVKIQKEKPLAL